MCHRTISGAAFVILYILRTSPDPSEFSLNIYVCEAYPHAHIIYVLCS